MHTPPVSDVVSILKTVGIVCCEIPAVICLFIPAFETGMSGRRCGGLGHRPLLYMSLIHIHLRITVYLFRPGPATTRLITPMTGCPSGCSCYSIREYLTRCSTIASAAVIRREGYLQDLNQTGAIPRRLLLASRRAAGDKTPLHLYS